MQYAYVYEHKWNLEIITFVLNPLCQNSWENIKVMTLLKNKNMLVDQESVSIEK